MEDALTSRSDEGRGVTAISLGEPSSRLRSGDVRMRQLYAMLSRIIPTLKLDRFSAKNTVFNL